MDQINQMIRTEGSAGFESITGDMRARYLLSLNNIGGSFMSTAPVQCSNVLGQKTRDQTCTTSDVHMSNGNYIQVQRSFVTIAIFFLILQTRTKCVNTAVPRQRLPESSLLLPPLIRRSATSQTQE